MNNKRINRISEEVKKVLSELLYNGLKDPRVTSMTTVTEVKVTRDLSFANVYVSVLGDKKEKEDCLKGLQSAKGFIRSEIGKRIDLRHVPEPIFHLDETLEHAGHISDLLEQVKKEDNLRGIKDE